MSKTLIYPNFTPFTFNFLFQDPANHVRIHRNGKLIVLLSDGKRDGNSHLLNVVWHVQETRVAREIGVVHGLAINLVLWVGKEDNMLANPTKSGRTDGCGLSDFPTECLKEGLNGGERLPWPVTNDPGHEPVHGPEEVVWLQDVLVWTDEGFHSFEDPGRARMASISVLVRFHVTRTTQHTQHEVRQVYPVVTLDGIGIGQDLVVDEVDTKGIRDDDDDTLDSLPCSGSVT